MLSQICWLPVHLNTHKLAAGPAVDQFVTQETLRTWLPDTREERTTMVLKLRCTTYHRTKDRVLPEASVLVLRAQDMLILTLRQADPQSRMPGIAPRSRAHEGRFASNYYCLTCLCNDLSTISD